MELLRINEYTAQKETICQKNDHIDPALYDAYVVKRGLRDKNGNGVLAGLTNISQITSSQIIDGKKIPCDGKLWYRGHRVEDLMGPNELGYEKIAYLLLMGNCRTKTRKPPSSRFWESPERCLLTLHGM